MSVQSLGWVRRGRKYRREIELQLLLEQLFPALTTRWCHPFMTVRLQLRMAKMRQVRCNGILLGPKKIRPIDTEYRLPAVRGEGVGGLSEKGEVIKQKKPS